MSEKGKAVETAKTADNEAVRMYVGPTFQGVSKSSVYTNGLPVPLKEKVEKYPLFGELVVNIEDLAKKKKELEDPASAISRCYKAAVAVLKGGE